MTRKADEAAVAATGVTARARPRAELALATTFARPGPPRPVEPALDALPRTAVFELARGALVGRYVIINKLGEGGMGVVYAAYDPELDRKVALKLWRTDGSEAGSVNEAGARLLREAQALARLSHPNIVAVHDVGTVCDRVWMAMEFVAGQTLGQWLRARKRDWREVLTTFVRAGEGLRGAHAAGIVHRDFKPENVMVSPDGRVRVMDFGLARAEASDHKDMSSTFTDMRSSKALETALTQAGEVVGTPYYMAPEQWDGAATDARTDQFAYCVALWEGLYGELPFAGATRAELRVAVTFGELRAPPAGARVPGWLRRVVQRGLAPEPAQRWESMAALLAALRGDPTRRNRALVVAGTAAALVGGTLGMWQVGHARKVQACAAQADEIAALWSDEAQGRVREAMRATGVALADTTFEKASPWLDAHARRLAEVQRETCHEATVTETLEPELHARMQACLDERRTELSELLSLLSAPRPETVYRAVAAAAELPAADTCLDRGRLGHHEPVPEAAREEAEVVRRLLARVTALGLAGDYKTAATEAAAAEQRAAALDLPVLLARVRVAAGNAAVRLGDYPAAQGKYEEAFYAAGSVGADEVAGQAAHRLISVVGVLQAQHEKGLGWAKLAEMSLKRQAIGEDDLRRAVVLNALASLHNERSAYAEALEFGARALAIRERALGPEHPSVAESLMNLGNVHARQGNNDEAHAHYQRALEIRERAFGPGHPDVGSALNNLGAVSQSRRAFREAIAHYQRALEIFAVTLRPEHPQVANTLSNLGRLHEAMRDHEKALEHHRRALEIREKLLGPDHPDVASSLTGLGRVHGLLGRHAKALAQHERARSILERALGPDNPKVALVWIEHGQVQERRGKLEEALADYRRALKIFEKAQGPERVHIARPLLRIGKLELARNRADVAIPLLERALVLRTSEGAAPVDLAEAQFALASALRSAERHPQRALELATLARATYRALGEDVLQELAAVEAWMSSTAERPRRGRSRHG